MYNLKCYTEKNFLTSVSYDLMHEWEEDFVKYLNIKMVDLYRGYIGKGKRNIIRFTDKARKAFGLDKSKFKIAKKKTWHIMFVPNALVYLNYTHFSNIIPIFIDFPEDMVEKIAHATTELPVYFVTAYDIYEKLKFFGSYNVEFIPMGISDDYISEEAPKKTIDVVQFGRRNEKLHKWMTDYCKDHPQVEYVYVKNKNFEYYSTTRGEIGRYECRKEFCELIDNTKIALVSSPGVEGESRFGSIDFITPRFYECAAHYCFMVGRYTRNKEVELIGLKDVCPNVDSQEKFNEYINEYIKCECSMNVMKYKNFLGNNVMSKRVESVKNAIDKRLI